MAALVAGRLLVIPKMEVAGIVKHFGDILDDILAHLIVLLGGDHPVVVLEPRVVACGEVELGNHLKPHSAQTGELLAEPLHAPGPLDREFRMAGILDNLRKVYDYLVAAGLRKGGGDPLPGRLVETHMVRAAARKPLLRHGRILRLERDVAP